MKKSSRKQFLKTITLGALGATAASSCTEPKKIEASNINFNNKYKWKMVSTWPPNFPILGEGCNLFAEIVNKLSGGRIEIKVFGAGELVPAFEVFEAVSAGAAEMGSGASYYWAGKNPALQFFASVPYGMNAQQVNAWMYAGDGYDLWKDIYSDYNLVPFVAGNTGVQMGGWFNKEINSISDFKGLKMRMPGLGGKVLNKSGATTVLVAGGELYTNLERGVIDATEWIGPYHDYIMGFHKIARYYYTPGWHEPGTILEFMMTKRLFDSLPSDIQEIVKIASSQLNIWTLAQLDAKNNEYLIKIKEESQVEIREFPDDVLDKLKKNTDEVLDELVSSNDQAKKVYDSYKRFHKNINAWSNLSERQYYSRLQRD